MTGFSGVDLVGQAGLEEQYDQELRGTPAQTRCCGQRGRAGHRHPQADPGRAPATTLVTSINAQLQQDTQNALAQAIQPDRRPRATPRPATGAAVVMTTTGPGRRDGQLPDLQPERLDRRHLRAGSSGTCSGPRDGEPILNRATQGEYAPGSTWKVTSTAAALAARLLHRRPVQLPGGGHDRRPHLLNDWTTQNLGPMCLHQALVMSCDTVFYQLAYDIWLRDHPRAD